MPTRRKREPTMAKPKEPKSDPRWVREASAILDEMERNPPSEESLAPFRTKNWIDKGEGMLAGLRPVPGKKDKG